MMKLRRRLRPNLVFAIGESSSLRYDETPKEIETS